MEAKEILNTVLDFILKGLIILWKAIITIVFVGIIYPMYLVSSITMRFLIQKDLDFETAVNQSMKALDVILEE
jgi:hypothetical protein